MDWAKVFTPKMLSATGSLATSLLAQACVQKPLGDGIGIGSLFPPNNEHVELGTVNFDATLARDFAGFARSTMVEVQVDLQYGDLAIRGEGGEASFAWGAVVSPAGLLQDHVPANRLRWL